MCRWPMVRSGSNQSKIAGKQRFLEIEAAAYAQSSSGSRAISFPVMGKAISSPEKIGEYTMMPMSCFNANGSVADSTSQSLTANTAVEVK